MEQPLNSQVLTFSYSPLIFLSAFRDLSKFADMSGNYKKEIRYSLYIKQMKSSKIIPLVLSVYKATGYIDLMQRSTPVVSTSHSTFDGTMQVLCSYCMHRNSCHSSIRVPS